MSNRKQKVIVHLSPTDIRYDSRILKELKALEQISKVSLHAFGVHDPEGHTYNTNSAAYIRTFKLLSKKIKIIPRPLRYFLNLIEAIFVITPRSIRLKPDIIHCHDTLFLPIALITKFFTGCILIYDAHELESNKSGQSKVLSKFTILIERTAWKRIDLLISVSPSILSWYHKKFGPKNDLLILNSPVLESNKIDDEKEGRNYLREKFEIPDNEKIYIYLGIVSKLGRNIDLYLKVFQSEDVKDHIVFIGYGDYVGEVHSVAAKTRNIHYHPAVPHNEVVKISKSADVGLCLIEPVSLSDYYCLPNKLFEYAFSGLYIIGSDFPDIAELVAEYNLGKCSKSDYEDLHSVVKEIERMALPEREKHDLYKLSWEYQGKQLIANYQILLKN